MSAESRPSLPAGIPQIFSGPLLENPYPLYASLRASSPVFQVPIPADVGAGVFVLTRHADVHQALRDPRLSADRRRSDAISRNQKLIPRQVLGDEGLFRSMLMMDAPDHTRVRGLVNKAFTPRRVAELRPHVETIAKSLLAEPAAAREMDLIAQFSAPLPAIVIAELFGIPPDDRVNFNRERIFGPVEGTPLPPGAVPRGTPPSGAPAVSVAPLTGASPAEPLPGEVAFPPPARRFSRG